MAQSLSDSLSVTPGDPECYPFGLCQALPCAHKMRALSVTIRGPVFALPSFTSTSFLPNLFSPPPVLFSPLRLPSPFPATNSFPLLPPISPFPPLFPALSASSPLSNFPPSLFSLFCPPFSSPHIPSEFLFFFLPFSFFPSFSSFPLYRPDLEPRSCAPVSRRCHTESCRQLTGGDSAKAPAARPESASPLRAAPCSPLTPHSCRLSFDHIQNSLRLSCRLSFDLKSAVF